MTTTLDKYKLIEEIGRGGFGTVYRARDTILDVERAVKVLHPALVTSPEFIERFRREGRLSARLEHPNIVPVYELGEVEGRYFLAMKYLPGGSLKDVLAEKGRLPFEQALEITRQLADALAYAYNQPGKLIHRDLKPGNILFESLPNGESKAVVRLSDFGFAKALAEAGTSSASSASGGMLGTPAYMAPEVWRGQSANPTTDQYALACVLYEMLTGQALFQGDTPPEIMTKHVLDGPQFPARWPQDVPAGMESVLRRALATKPEERYPDVAAFGRACTGLLAGPAPQETKPPEVRVPPAPVPEPVAQHNPSSQPKMAPPVQKMVETVESAIPFRSMSFWKLGGLISIVILIFIIIVTIINGREPALTPSTDIPVTVSPIAHSTSKPIINTQNSTATPSPTNTLPPTLRPGATQTRKADGMTMVYVPIGEFQMGSTRYENEMPVHKVFLDAFWIDQTEVTNSMYQKCVESGHCNPPGDIRSWTRGYYYGNVAYDDYPVVAVTWEMANEYCSWVSARLPAEAEWEKAARGTDGRTYAWGNAPLDDNLINYGRVVGDTTKVGSYPKGASPYGAFDMLGNVWEWVNDWYDADYYKTSPQRNPSGPESSSHKVVRGGSWASDEWYVRTANRNSEDSWRFWLSEHSVNPDFSAYSIGFRCSMSE